MDMAVIELKGGTTNRLMFDPLNSVVIKQFASGNGLVQSMETRLQAERWSMQHIPFAPSYKGGGGSTLIMSFVDGEADIDDQIDGLPEHTQHVIYFKAGMVLANTHKTLQLSVPHGYHDVHMRRMSSLICDANYVLYKNRVDVMDLLTFMYDSYHRDEIEKRGFVWNHGDYWLANVIGQRRNGSFDVSSVVDWETAGVKSPYDDFAIVEMSVERMHTGAVDSFWKGYGSKPDRALQRHFSILKTLEWISGEDASNEFQSKFYQDKFLMMRESLDT